MATKTSKFQPLEFTPINFSLTDGTDIPPPPDSPAEARPPTPGRGPLSSHPTTPRVGAFPADALSTNNVEAASAALERAISKDASNSSSPPSKPAVSPAVSKRPSSVRRFLGIKTSSSGDSLYPDKDNRPMSPMSTHTFGGDSQRSLSRKKSTSWFGKRKSMMFVAKVDDPSTEATKENQAPPQRKGPPPPTIPEFAALDSMLGSDLDADDMFKNIK